MSRPLTPCISTSVPLDPDTKRQRLAQEHTMTRRGRSGSGKLRTAGPCLPSSGKRATRVYDTDQGLAGIPSMWPQAQVHASRVARQAAQNHCASYSHRHHSLRYDSMMHRRVCEMYPRAFCVQFMRRHVPHYCSKRIPGRQKQSTLTSAAPYHYPTTGLLSEKTFSSTSHLRNEG